MKIYENQHRSISQIHLTDPPPRSTSQIHFPDPPTTSTFQIHLPDPPPRSTSQIHLPAPPLRSTSYIHLPRSTLHLQRCPPLRAVQRSLPLVAAVSTAPAFSSQRCPPLALIFRGFHRFHYCSTLSTALVQRSSIWAQALRPHI